MSYFSTVYLFHFYFSFISNFFPPRFYLIPIFSQTLYLLNSLQKFRYSAQENVFMGEHDSANMQFAFGGLQLISWGCQIEWIVWFSERFLQTSFMITLKFTIFFYLPKKIFYSNSRFVKYFLKSKLFRNVSIYNFRRYLFTISPNHIQSP